MLKIDENFTSKVQILTWPQSLQLMLQILWCSSATGISAVIVAMKFQKASMFTMVFLHTGQLYRPLLKWDLRQSECIKWPEFMKTPSFGLLRISSKQMLHFVSSVFGTHYKLRNILELFKLSFLFLGKWTYVVFVDVAWQANFASLTMLVHVLSDTACSALHAMEWLLSHKAVTELTVEIVWLCFSITVKYTCY